jgi:hypothetical protein
MGTSAFCIIDDGVCDLRRVVKIESDVRGLRPGHDDTTTRRHDVCGGGAALRAVDGGEIRKYKKDTNTSSCICGFLPHPTPAEGRCTATATIAVRDSVSLSRPGSRLKYSHNVASSCRPVVVQCRQASSVATVLDWERELPRGFLFFSHSPVRSRGQS